jgi:hypothetical protein
MNHHNMNSASETKDQQLSEHLECTCEAALKRMKMWRDKIIASDILATPDEEWSGDADHLQYQHLAI